MFSSRLSFGMVVLVIAHLAAAPAQARGGHGRGHGPPGGPGYGGGFHPERLDAVAEQLGVDAKTLAKIKDLVFEHRKDHIGLKAAVEEAHLELQRMMDADRPNMDAVMRQVDAVGKLETKFKKSRIRMMLEVRGLLTPEQRVQLRSLLWQHRGRGEGRGPGRGPWRGQP